MEKIYQHIEKLLAEHDYVVVPGLGGFVLQMQSAKLLDNRITPPLASIGFNPLMQYSDGLLAIEIARAEKISYRAAVERIGSEVEKLKFQLTASVPVQIGGLGFLSRNPNGNYLFAPTAKADFLPANFGLHDVYATEIEKQNTNNSKKVVVQFPTRQTYKYAAAVALIFGMLFITPRVNDVKQTGYANLATLTLVGDSTPAALVDSLVETEAAIVSPKNDSTSSSGNYHVIVASLPSKKAAERYRDELVSEKYQEASVMAPKKTYRVAIKSFDEKDKAVKYMQDLRESDSRFESAWVSCK